MSKGREIRCFDYVNHPYEQVRDALVADAPTVFQAATKAAASRAQSVASELRVNIGGIGVATDISISVTKIEEKISESMGTPGTRLALEWEAANMPTCAVDGRSARVAAPTFAHCVPLTEA